MTDVANHLDDPRFSRTFEWPADPESNRPRPFKVKYADYGYRNEANPEEEHVILFFGSLLGSRLVHIPKDDVARKYKIRIINPDRPGFGGTDPIDVKKRLTTWPEVLIALLQHLGIQHVSICAHSAGTVYAMQMILHHPDILDPERPYVAIGGPWVLPSHTNSTLFAIVNCLPAALLNNTDKFARLMQFYIGPMIGRTLGFSQAAVAKISKPAEPSSENRKGLDREGAMLEKKLRNAIINRTYEEGLQGMSADAVLLMQKVDGSDGWGDWRDYDTLVSRLEEIFRTLGKKLTVEVMFAEEDGLIGDAGSKGPMWLDKCWEAKSNGWAIDYHSSIVKGSDHDEVWNLRWGAVQQVFAKISGIHPEEETETL